MKQEAVLVAAIARRLKQIDIAGLTQVAHGEDPTLTHPEVVSFARLALGLDIPEAPADSFPMLATGDVISPDQPRDATGILNEIFARRGAPLIE